MNNRPRAIRIGKTRITAEGGAEASEVFTLTFGVETIPLLPFKNWGQLDAYKWRVQGKLPGTPAGLEITPDHVKIAGKSVAVLDPEGCAKLEDAFNQWLALENSNLELARKRDLTRASAPAVAPVNSAAVPVRFKVQLDKGGQVHIQCVRGGELLAAVGLTVQGFQGLFSQGLLRKPRTLDIGALHDWIELDGELCSFEHGSNDSLKLERLLNGKYFATGGLGQGKDIVIFTNAASPTGFDIQFPVTVGGVPENRRRTLNDSALELLHDTQRCGLLQPGLIIKISPPTLIFKKKTPDGGETYLEPCTANRVVVAGDQGKDRVIDLSQPVNYARLGVVELTAVFNHPVINRHAGPPARTLAPTDSAIMDPLPASGSSPTLAAPMPPALAVPPQNPAPRLAPAPEAPTEQVLPASGSRSSSPAPAREACPPPTSPENRPHPNAWLGDILARDPIRFDWLACLVYSKIAEHFSNSREGSFGQGKCWAVALGPVTEVSASEFKGVFLTQKGGLGFLGNGRMIRFHRGVVFLGTRDSVQEGIGVNLVAAGVDQRQRIVFIVSADFLPRFGVPVETIERELTALSEAGALLLSCRQAVESAEPLTLVWSAPAVQADPMNPQAIEDLRPAMTGSG